MSIGLLQIDLQIGEGHSLKEKRMIMNSVKTRIRSKFNVSVAELDYHDLWQRALIGVCCIETDRSRAHRLLEQVVSFVETCDDCSILDYQIEML